jgi:hypothetical protein
MWNRRFATLANARNGTQTGEIEMEPINHAIRLIYHGQNQRPEICFHSQEAAHSAFKLLTEAMRKYREFGNDKDATIELDGIGDRHVVVLRQLEHVVLADLAQEMERSMAITVRVADHERRVREAVPDMDILFPKRS